jgi:hypothetical protein
MLDDVDKLLAITKSKDVIEVSDESVPQDVDTSAQLESEDYAKQQKIAELANYRQDTHLRKAFAWAGYWMNIGWLIVILVIIFLSGFHRWNFSLIKSLEPV